MMAAAFNTSQQMPQDIRWMNTASGALMALVLVVLVLAVGSRLSHLSYFDIAALRIDGDLQRSNLASVRASALPRLEGSFFDLNMGKAREAFEAVPWVRRAVVRRVWPDELRVTLQEHQPAAYWHLEERDDQLVNTFGEVFDANLGDVEDEALPTLTPPPGPSAEQARAMLDMLQGLNGVLAPLQSRIDTLRLSARGSWSVVLEDGASIELGRGGAQEVLERTQRFVRTLPDLQRQYPAPLTHADLRYPEGYAVRLRGMITLQAAAKAAAARTR